MNARHGTAVARNNQGVLIVGASGSGKSSLALQLMALGADLVADDAVQLSESTGKVWLSCPASIQGMIEARGVGLLSVKSIEKAMLAFVVDLDETPEKRLPEPKMVSLFGVNFPLICGKGNPDLAAVIWCLLGGGQVLPTV